MAMPPAVRKRHDELSGMMLTEEGKSKVDDIYRNLHGIPAGQMLHRGTSLIIGILEKEFPNDS